MSLVYVAYLQVKIVPMTYFFVSIKTYRHVIVIMHFMRNKGRVGYFIMKVYQALPMSSTPNS